MRTTYNVGIFGLICMGLWACFVAIIGLIASIFYFLWRVLMAVWRQFRDSRKERLARIPYAPRHARWAPEAEEAPIESEPELSGDSSTEYDSDTPAKAVMAESL